IPAVVAGELVEHEQADDDEDEGAPTLWHTVPPSRSEVTRPGGPRRPPRGRGPSSRHSATKAVSATPTQGLVDTERAAGGRQLNRRLVAVGLAVLAVVLVSIGIALASGGGSNGAGS